MAPGGARNPSGNTKLVLDERCDTADEALFFRMVEALDAGVFALQHIGGKCLQPEGGLDKPRDTQRQLCRPASGESSADRMRDIQSQQKVPLTRKS